MLDLPRPSAAACASGMGLWLVVPSCASIALWKPSSLPNCGDSASACVLYSSTGHQNVCAHAVHALPIVMAAVVAVCLMQPVCAGWKLYAQCGSAHLQPTVQALLSCCRNAHGSVCCLCGSHVCPMTSAFLRHWCCSAGLCKAATLSKALQPLPGTGGYHRPSKHGDYTVGFSLLCLQCCVLSQWHACAPAWAPAFQLCPACACACCGWCSIVMTAGAQPC
ncbi:hypothetical protein COO60DRAFT_1486272 [Scenedesmus sp. NREL 46B-D3]|nr:hypothetical protein COO60DRAFT_1486272 [Scenedesmus sp. NREL 46B-D3]